MLLLFAVCTFVAASAVVSLTAGNSRTVQIEQIDAQISELENKKRGFEARALKHENYAEYLQFDQQAVLETRRHLQLADENRAKAARVQLEINKLQVRKQRLVSLQNL
jgi:hypothetical protein